MPSACGAHLQPVLPAASQPHPTAPRPRSRQVLRPWRSLHLRRLLLLRLLREGLVWFAVGRVPRLRGRQEIRCALRRRCAAPACVGDRWLRRWGGQAGRARGTQLCPWPGWQRLAWGPRQRCLPCSPDSVPAPWSPPLPFLPSHPPCPAGCTDTVQASCCSPSTATACVLGLGNKYACRPTCAAVRGWAGHGAGCRLRLWARVAAPLPALDPNPRRRLRLLY